jgi:AI-2 transport protein TqsA
MIWGLTGAFLAAPITAVVRIIFERIPITRPLAAMLAGNLDVLSAEGDREAQSG